MRWFIIGTIALSPLAFIACDRPISIVDPPLVPDYHASPCAVISGVEVAFNARDKMLCEDLLAADGFTFHFNPRDVGSEVNGYVIPPAWTYAEFTDAAARIYEEAYSLSLFADTNEVGTPPASASEYTAGSVNVDLLFLPGENQVYRVDTGYCRFHFHKDAAGNWHLVTWRDFTEAAEPAAPVEVTSLGRVLAYYH